LEELRAHTPPWVVGLPAQVAAVKALADPDYYTARRDETHRMRARLAVALAALGWDVVPGAANFLLCHLPEVGPAARDLVASCREQGLFLRDAAAMGSGLGERAIRIAVKDVATNRRMIGILSGVTGTRWLSRERRSSDRLERPPLPV
jgi:histidinol-phosphate/aromatic aminotransferase/cobyric acid decarboxylase-like protein